MGGPTESLTLSSSEFPSDASVCSLSDVLETGERAAAVLFERASLSRASCAAPRSAERIAGTLGSRSTAGGGFGTDFELDGGQTPVYAPELAHALSAQAQVHWDESMDTVIAHSLRADGFDASEDGTGRGTPIVPVVAPCLTSNYGKQPDSSDTNAGPLLVAFSNTAGDTTLSASTESFPPLTTRHGDPGMIAFNLRGREGGSQPEVDDEGLANIRAASGGSSRTYVASSAARRLTPRECERLQGFPDDYTAVPYRNKPAADGPRYRALGNSMAVPVMSWIGERIEAFNTIIECQ